MSATLINSQFYDIRGNPRVYRLYIPSNEAEEVKFFRSKLTGEEDSDVSILFADIEDPSEFTNACTFLTTKAKQFVGFANHPPLNPLQVDSKAWADAWAIGKGVIVLWTDSPIDERLQEHYRTRNDFPIVAVSADSIPIHCADLKPPPAEVVARYYKIAATDGVVSVRGALFEHIDALRRVAERSHTTFKFELDDSRTGKSTVTHSDGKYWDTESTGRRRQLIRRPMEKTTLSATGELNDALDSLGL